MIVLGIDPGKQGGIAMLWDAHPSGAQDLRLRLAPMPLIKSTKGRDEYDIRAVVKLIDQALDGGPVVAFLEQLHAMPLKQGGTLANYNRGYGRALFEGIFAALEIPYTLVAPQTWQRAMLEGTSGADTKQRSIIAAQRLFPGVSFLPTPKSRKPSDGLSDAALLAEYGRRKRVGDAFAEYGRPEGARP